MIGGFSERILRRAASWMTAAVILCPGTAAAQSDTAAAETVVSWTLRAAPHADLWFHGLAVVGFEGHGRLALYSEDYTEAVVQAKREMGIYPTPLDQKTADFKRRFREDPTFEVLHFVPLYFPSVDAIRLLDLMDLVAQDEVDDAGISDSVTMANLRVLARLFNTKVKRRGLAEFLDALSWEWSQFLRGYRDTRQESWLQRIAWAQESWNEIGPKLGWYLRAVRLDTADVMISAPLGDEGRIFTRDARNRSDNVIALGFAQNGGGSADALSLVREMCFPLVSRLVVEAKIGLGDRVYQERVSSRVAVRCGAMLLEMSSPEQLPEYRRLYLSAVRRQDMSEAAFQKAFPVEAGLLNRLRELLDRGRRGDLDEEEEEG